MDKHRVSVSSLRDIINNVIFQELLSVLCVRLFSSSFCFANFFHFSIFSFPFLSGHLIKSNSCSFHHISFLSAHIFLCFPVLFPCICYLIASRQFKAGTQWELHVSSARVTGCTISFHLRAIPALSVYKMYGKTILMVSFSCVKWKMPQQNKQPALSSQGNWAGISKESKKWPLCVLFVSTGSREEWVFYCRSTASETVHHLSFTLHEQDPLLKCDGAAVNEHWHYIKW